MCYNMNNFYWRVLFFYGILYEFLKVNSLLVSCKLLKLKQLYFLYLMVYYNGNVKYYFGWMYWYNYQIVFKIYVYYNLLFFNLFYIDNCQEINDL